jgi:hypothetical protein
MYMMYLLEDFLVLRVMYDTIQPLSSLIIVPH